MKNEPEVPALITEEDHFQMVLDGAIFDGKGTIYK
jgi:hypothetical protein